MKKKLIILLCIIIGISMLISLTNAIRYPIRLKIESDDVVTAKITYYGDGVSEDITQQRDVKKLVRKLNKIRFKETEDMSHLYTRSGVRIIELYDSEGICIENIQFYDWAYRGGEYKGEETKNGEYLLVQGGFRLGNLYVLCDDLCGNPFGMGIYKIFYYLQ